MSTINVGETITLGDVADFFNNDLQIKFTKSCKTKMQKSRDVIKKVLKKGDPVYGVNTGFGRLAKTKIPESKLAELQRNLILSHACGVGEPLSPDIVRLMMLLRAHNLAHGFSGVRPVVVERLLDLIKHDITPVIPSKGSVGASGDLAPLAHLALVLIGEGQAWYEDEEVSGIEALERAGLAPLELEAKEGLALINGTQAMTACAALAVIWGFSLSNIADLCAALTVEGDRASDKPFSAKIQELRPHPGQIKSAQNLRAFLEGSKNISSHRKCNRVQDPYCIRCVPQVHGAAKDILEFAGRVVEREINAVTDNPIVFENEIISGGNFHGEPIAMAMDALANAFSELSSISERRIYLLTAPLGEELPYSFLTPDPGINSGFMIPHVTAASLVSENKMLCHPACVDSIPTSGGQEDHVSMGTISARRTLQVAENLEIVVGIELIAAAQAIDLQTPKKSLGKGTKAAYKLIRKHVPFIEKDVEMKPLLDAGRALAFMALNVAEEAVGGL